MVRGTCLDKGRGRRARAGTEHGWAAGSCERCASRQGCTSLCAHWGGGEGGVGCYLMLCICVCVCGGGACVREWVLLRGRGGRGGGGDFDFDFEELTVGGWWVSRGRSGTGPIPDSGRTIQIQTRALAAVLSLSACLSLPPSLPCCSCSSRRRSASAARALVAGLVLASRAPRCVSLGSRARGLASRLRRGTTSASPSPPTAAPPRTEPGESAARVPAPSKSQRQELPEALPVLDKGPQ